MKRIIQICSYDKLLEILAYENPEIVIPSIRGDYQSQLNFHKTLADWLSGKQKRLLYISTANVFDGDLSKPWTEHDPPMPESDYGSFKRDCETMLGNILENQLIFFRLAAVWSADCPRVQQLKRHSQTKEPYYTYPDYNLPQFVAETEGTESFFAILPTRKEIPDSLRMTVSDVLSALK